MEDFIRQYPTPPNEWLYQDQQDGSRIFSDYIIRNAAAPAWLECTTAEKEEWEREHPDPENE